MQCSAVYTAGLLLSTCSKQCSSTCIYCTCNTMTYTAYILQRNCSVLVVYTAESVRCTSSVYCIYTAFRCGTRHSPNPFHTSLLQFLNALSLLAFFGLLLKATYLCVRCAEHRIARKWSLHVELLWMIVRKWNYFVCLLNVREITFPNDQPQNKKYKNKSCLFLRVKNIRWVVQAANDLWWFWVTTQPNWFMAIGCRSWYNMMIKRNILFNSIIWQW